MDTTHRWILEMPPFENGLTFNAAASQLLLTITLILAGLLLTYIGLRVLKAAVLMAERETFVAGAVERGVEAAVAEVQILM